MLFLTACGELAPLDSPIPLENTAGAPVTITDDVYITEAFQARYPDGWRIVTSASVNPPSVIFASPDETSLIFVSTEILTDLPRPLVIHEGDTMQEQTAQAITTHGDTVYLALIAPDSQFAEMATLFEQVTANID